jgi:Mycolic acid cyclopropane synthetase
MMYSCALWSEAEGGVRGDLEMGPSPGDLEVAQLRKIHHVLDAARVKPGDRILEFGSGWGGLAIEVVIDIKFKEWNQTQLSFIGRAVLWLRGGYLDIVHRAKKSCRGTH